MAAVADVVNKPLLPEYDDTDTEDEEELEDRVKASEHRGTNFSISDDGCCPRCAASDIAFVILDKLFPMFDMPDILNKLITNGKAVLWSSQEQKKCKDPPTFLCRGFCPPDPLGAGFNINWDNVKLNKILAELSKMQAQPMLPKVESALQDPKDETLQDEQEQEMGNDDNESDKDSENKDSDDKDRDDKESDDKESDDKDSGDKDSNAESNDEDGESNGGDGDEWIVLDELDEDDDDDDSSDVDSSEELHVFPTEEKTNELKGPKQTTEEEDEIDEESLIQQMLAKEQKKTKEQIKLVNVTIPSPEEPTIPGVIPLFLKQKLYGPDYAAKTASETIPSAISSAVAAAAAANKTNTSSTNSSGYPVSDSGDCPYCKSTNVLYIILVDDVNCKDTELPLTLQQLLRRGSAFKMAKGASEPPSFQCNSCYYGFNLNWSTTNLEKIFGIGHTGSSSVQPLSSYSTQTKTIYIYSTVSSTSETSTITQSSLNSTAPVSSNNSTYSYPPPTIPPPSVPGISIPPPSFPVPPPGIPPPGIPLPGIPPPGIPPPGIPPPGIPPLVFHPWCSTPWYCTSWYCTP